MPPPFLVEFRAFGPQSVYITFAEFQMTRFNRFSQHAALSAILLCFSIAVHADDLQEASKLIKQGQPAQALVKVDTILTRHPRDAQARFLKGVILSEQEQTDEAIRIFTALTVDYPALPEPYNNLAVIYAAQGQYEKAKSALETALHTNISYATAYENLSDIYAKMASQAYDKALQLDRSNSNSKTRLALLKDITPTTVKLTEGKTQIASLDKPVVTAAKAVPATAANVKTETAASSSHPVAAAAIASTEPAKIEPAKPLPVVTQKSLPASDEDILKAVHEWARAWSSRNAGKYLAMYAKDFKTPHNVARSVWEKQRRERIAKPQPITVTIINARVKIKDENTASVSFVQSYRSGSLKSTTRKTLEMTRANGSWLIQAELAGV
jgi:tetratricopeptide (TPR) repeat protein